MKSILRIVVLVLIGVVGGCAAVSNNDRTSKLPLEVVAANSDKRLMCFNYSLEARDGVSQRCLTLGTLRQLVKDYLAHGPQQQ